MSFERITITPSFAAALTPPTDPITLIALARTRLEDSSINSAQAKTIIEGLVGMTNYDPDPGRQAILKLLVRDMAIISETFGPENAHVIMQLGADTPKLVRELSSFRTAEFLEEASKINYAGESTYTDRSITLFEQTLKAIVKKASTDPEVAKEVADSLYDTCVRFEKIMGSSDVLTTHIETLTPLLSKTKHVQIAAENADFIDGLRK